MPTSRVRGVDRVHRAAAHNFTVDFRMIVFRPFKGEIINAEVKQCTPDGIQREFARSMVYLTLLTGISRNTVLYGHLRAEDDVIRGL